MNRPAVMTATPTANDGAFRIDVEDDGYRLVSADPGAVEVLAHYPKWSSCGLEYWMSASLRNPTGGTQAGDRASEAIYCGVHDAMSAASRTEVARLLGKDCEDPNIDWYSAIAALDERVIRAERQRVLRKFGARTLAKVPADPPPPMLVGKLDPSGHTILYGSGGVGKGVLAASWIVQLVRVGHRVLVIDYEGHPSEWSRRIGSLGDPDVLKAVTHVAPFSPDWASTRGPLWEVASAIGALADGVSATCLVVDSIVPACAGIDPMQPDAASRYVSALQLINRPVLSLAHVTKADDARYPFGSVFWHNLARTTWSLAPTGEAASHGMALVHRKHNNYPNAGRHMLMVEWRDGLPVEVVERSYAPPLAEQIRLVLGDADLSVTEIVAALNDDLDDGGEAVKSDSVRKTLRRGVNDGRNRFAVAGTGATARWSNA